MQFLKYLISQWFRKTHSSKEKEDPVLFPASANSYISFFLFCPYKEKIYLCVTVRQLAKRKQGWKGDEITAKGAVMCFSLQKVFSHFTIFLIVVKMIIIT